MSDLSELEADDDMTGFMDNGFSSVSVGRPRPQRNAEANAGSESGGAVTAIAKPSGESGIEFDHDHLAQFRHSVAVAGESNPLPDMSVLQSCPLFIGGNHRRFLFHSS
jgi:hypothetical protein